MLFLKNKKWKKEDTPFCLNRIIYRIIFSFFSRHIYAQGKKENFFAHLGSNNFVLNRRHPDSNWGIKDLQSSALPLGYAAFFQKCRSAVPEAEVELCGHQRSKQKKISKMQTKIFLFMCLHFRKTNKMCLFILTKKKKKSIPIFKRFWTFLLWIFQIFFT